MHLMNEGLYLRQLSITDGEDIYQLLQQIEANEHEFKNDAFGMDCSEFKEWLELQDNWANNRCLPEGYVPQTIYWLFQNDTPVGFGKIRHRLNEHSRIIGGNIGYAIGKPYRGHGYGTELMKLLVIKADELGVTEKLATVEKDNPASKKAIERAGGKLVKETEERWYFEF